MTAMMAATAPVDSAPVDNAPVDNALTESAVTAHPAESTNPAALAVGAGVGQARIPAAPLRSLFVSIMWTLLCMAAATGLAVFLIATAGQSGSGPLQPAQAESSSVSSSQ